MKTEKEKVKEKIIWYCKELGIEPPKEWSYEEVRSVSEKINEKSAIILVCKNCEKVDIHFGHVCNFAERFNKEMAKII